MKSGVGNRKYLCLRVFLGTVAVGGVVVGKQARVLELPVRLGKFLIE